MKQRKLYDIFITVVILLEAFIYIFNFYTLYFIDFQEENIYEVSKETQELVEDISEEMGVDEVSPRMLKSCVSCKALSHPPTKQIWLTEERDEQSIRHELGHLKQPAWFGNVMMGIAFIGFCSSLYLDKKEWRLYVMILLAYPFFALELIANYYSSLLFFAMDLFFTVFIWVILYYKFVGWLYGRLG